MMRNPASAASFGNGHDGAAVHHTMWWNDAACIALTQGIACPLVTADTRLAASPAINCEIGVLAVDT